jgi:hypothetical protein
MSVTLVTAFYPVPSKFPTSKYLEWIRIFMTLEHANIVLYTSAAMAQTITALRTTYPPLHVIIMEFEDMDSWKLWGANGKWQEQHRIDPEAFRHSPQLYAVWAQKAFCLVHAARKNPFATTHFMWHDIGAFRSPIPEPIRRSYPSSTHFPSDQLLMLAIEPLRAGDGARCADGIRGHYVYPEIRNGGGIFGGTAKACERWLHAYTDMVYRYMAVGRFAGKEQEVMLSTYLHDASLATFVKSTVPDVSWFFLPYLCSEFGARFQVEESYAREALLADQSEIAS